MKIANYLVPAMLIAATALFAQSPRSNGANTQPIDEEYTRQILEFTTTPAFLTKFVDHLPASDTVPTPLDILGHIAGAADVLTYSHEVNNYMRAVADASPRVEVFHAGTSEEGREMIVVVVSNENAIANLNGYKAMSNKLADPRTISEDEAQQLISDSLPMYWATGAMHSGETGSPEMLMELVYRLAVEETPFIRAIRDNVIFMATPVLEVDGRDKRVDLLKLSQADPDARVPSLLYWGEYVAHDNNRDAMGMGLELSKMMMSHFLDFTPQVVHDLHESANHLYTSTGTGPYNAWVDPILVDEWHVLAYQEITEMTKMGVPGVWTHNFYDGWAPNYAFYVANGHNSIGRFYETQGAGNANNRVINTSATREWFRPNPPLAEVMWSMRNNNNIMQSALLIALNYVGTHRDTFMENFYMKSQRSIAKAINEGPAAYVFPANDPRPGQRAALLSLLQRQGCEVHLTTRDATIGDQEIAAGSYVVRMDQPYSRMADMLLDVAYYNVNAPRPYDDTGWTLGPLFNAQTIRIEDPAILDLYMEPVTEFLSGGLATLSRGPAVAYLINNNADKQLTEFRFTNPDINIQAAEAPFEMGGLQFNAGTFIIPQANNATNVGETLATAGQNLGFTAFSTPELPDVQTHSVGIPRVAVMHTWQSTQNEGWVRMALDDSKVPFDYISVHDVRDEPRLRSKWDVIVFGPSSGNALSIVNGLGGDDPVAWKATEVTPNIGRQDETDDMRGGLEFEGVVHLRDFIREGGTLITIQNSNSLPTHFGLAPGVSIATTEDLRASGSVLRAEVVDQLSPIAYGYGDSLGVYFRQAPVLRAGGGGGGRGFRGFGGRGRGGFGAVGSVEDSILAGTARPTGRGDLNDGDRVQGRPRDLGQESLEDQDSSGGPGGRGRGGRGGGGQQSSGLPAADAVRTIVRFVPDHQDLLISGMLAGGDELAGTPTVIDAPLGDGHVVLFGINPMWRHSTHGTYAMVFNTILHHDNLSAGTAGRPVESGVGNGNGNGNR